MNVALLCGSLRQRSVNKALLEAIALIAPPPLQCFRAASIGTLPLFNPDDESVRQPAVDALCADIAAADALIVASPEYAHGIPGAMKNALDWMVGRGTLMGKRVIVPNTSPRSGLAHRALVEVLRTIDAEVLSDPRIDVPLTGTDTTPAVILASLPRRRAVDAIFALLNIP